MKKKLLLFILLLLPSFVFAKDSYRIETSQEISGIIGEIIDNGDSYILQSETSLARVDKKTGNVKTQPFTGEKAWANYNQAENKLEAKESSHYLVYSDDTENGYILDKNFNLINTIDASDIDIDIFFINNHIIASNVYSNSIKIEVYDKNLNNIKTSRVDTDCWYEYYEDRNLFYSTQSTCASTIYTVNNNMDIVETNIDNFISHDDENVFILNTNTGTKSKIVPITTGYIDEMYLYKGYYYLHYEENDRKYLIKFDENLNELKRRDITTVDGVEYTSWSWLMYFNGYMFYEGEIEDYNGNDIRVFSGIDENLNFIPSSSIESFKSNVMTYTDYTRKYPDLTGMHQSKQIMETLSEHYIADILDVKKYQNKYYYLSFTIDYENELYKVKGYISIYDKNNTFIKKTKILDETYDTLDTSYAIGCLNYIDNTILASFSYPQNSDIVSIDLNGELKETNIEFNETLFVPFYSIIDGNTTITTSINKNYLTGSSTTAKSKVTFFKSLNETNISSGHGEVTMPDDAYYGDEVELDIKPDEGYQIKNITIKDENGNIIPVVDNKFTMPNGNITIDVEYEKIEENPYTLDLILLFISVLLTSIITFIYTRKKEQELK